MDKQEIQKIKARVRAKKWREDNPERYNAQMKKYRDDGRYKEWRKGYMFKYNQEYYAKTAEYQRERSRNWKKQNPEKVREQQRIWTAKMIKEDLHYHLASIFRRRIYNAMKLSNGKRAYKSMELLGCSIQQAKEHLEERFRDGMTWSNYGKYWQIDHIIPVSSFNLSNPEEQKRCFHYTNLQPLTKRENAQKSNKILTS